MTMNQHPELKADELIDRAATQSGCEPSGATWREGMEIFLHDFNRSETVNAIGQTAGEAWTVDALSARFGIDDWLSRHPETLQQRVKSPVFILGMPRAGTTMLLNLLALDPQHRVYWNWESNREVPPVSQNQLHTDPRIARKVAEINAALESGFLDERHHVELGDEPCECVWLLGQDFKSYPWVILTYAPTFMEWWMKSADMVAAYRHHKRALQVMQSRAGGQWILKFPTHAVSIDALLAVYPDAKIIATHRDPIKPLGSSCGASFHLTKQFNDGLDPALVGRQTLEIITRSLENLCQVDSKHPNTPIFHLHYEELVADPLAAITQLYSFMGEELTDPTRMTMNKALETHHRRRQKAGQNRYSLEEYGLSEPELPAIFHDYCRQFDIGTVRQGPV
jgi:Sulfotransferase family